MPAVQPDGARAQIGCDQHVAVGGACTRKHPTAAYCPLSQAAAHASVQSRQNVPEGCDATAERRRAARIHTARKTWVEAVDPAAPVH